jgi:hypothetical protein
MVSIGFTPMAMLWRPEVTSREKWEPDHRRRPFPRRWARPAIIHARDQSRPPKAVLIARKALDADQQNRRPPGRPKNVDNERRDGNGSRPIGNMAAAALRRLEQRCTDLLDRVLAGELNAHAAMVEAGFRKHSERLKRASALGRIERLLPLLTHAEPERLSNALALVIQRDGYPFGGA